MPIYHMSILKVPMSVLHRFKSIRSYFFSGHDLNSKKTSWAKWKNVLASKEKGGLGVSSLYALNKGLMGGVEQEQYKALMHQVHDVSLVPMRARQIWSLESSGDFSVTSVRKLIDDKMLPKVATKTRWIKSVPIK
ncbi:hypothetical protein Tco_1574636, partial [Tanacetum coccineum]